MIPQFALSLVCGLSLTWCLMPRRQVTSGFFRIQNLLTLGLSVLVLLTIDQLPSLSAGTSLVNPVWLRVGAIAAAVTSFVSSVLWTLERRAGGTWGAWLLCGLSLLLLVGTQSRGAGLVPAVVSALSSAWLIGGSTAAMLLGHWYLTARGMPLAPLIRLNWQYLAAVVARAAVGIGLVMFASTSLLSQHPVWWLLRWGAGIVGPFVLAILVFRILRYRNTQSATGVLFAAVILVFMGEMAASLLQQSLGQPV